ncbi:hypothetical protein EPH_0000240 [Eimeria praecox]|uniref:Uncharacterized protein n=1 Tax=Eimeria praecox TaxID=51316 RepID=U6HAL5_9EIME|nr:hypothetical protein EPH_0000240 [Eimeria praecox]
MLLAYIQSDELEWEQLLPALELAYNATSHSSTELSPFEVMIGEDPLTAADLDIVGPLAPTLTPPMTKLFRKLCDRIQSHIMQAKWRQKYCADPARREVGLYHIVSAFFSLFAKKLKWDGLLLAMKLAR